jgi:BirA family biotin operon repressor/biotin-[acetyl-CoA-carboxylase] ligase
VRLSSEAQAAGYRLSVLDETDSTSNDALAAARAGDPGRHWFVAHRQTAGRGRHGRAWASPPGNLYASLLLVEPCKPNVAPQLGFIAGIAAHDAVSRLTGSGAPRLALKWPNDLLIDGGKLAGLLLEGQFVQPGGAFCVAIGIGLNVAAAPQGTPYPTRTLAAIGATVAVADLFAALSAAFAQAYEPWRAAQAQGRDGFAAVRQAWLARAAGIGGPVTLRLPSGERQGAFRGLDASGRLQLETASGPEVIDAGDLYFSNRDTPSSARPGA